MQSESILEKARLARDRRFDGQFYIAVLTTGIYCRPVCPARAPKAENVRFYETAAAAGEAGFRPCLRCRPECAPGSPAWAGTSTTVRRALRLIGDGALDRDDVEVLSERLGVTSRHLRRLFAEHIGASPLSVAHTQRLHFAKRLIDDTSLSLGEIAIASGFGSVRRFNDAFRNSYGRSPRELRQTTHPPAAERTAALSVRLPYRQPFDWQGFLAFLKPRLVAGVETIEGDRYYRVLTVAEAPGVIDIAPHRQGGFLELSLHGIASAGLFEAVQATRAFFDLDAPVDNITRALSADPLLRPLITEMPGVRVPGAWDGFELAVRAILGQQISVKAATTLAGRVALRYGERVEINTPMGDRLSHRFPGPERLARARFNDMGIVGARIETLRRLASAAASGALDFHAAADPEEVIAQLCAIKGIGPWTAQYIAMRALKHPDAMPTSDLGLLKMLFPDRRATPRELAEHAEQWRPWRAYAALLIWNRDAVSGG